MYNIISNLDIEEDAFDISEEMVLHVTKNLPHAIIRSHADLVLIFDTDKPIRGYIKGMEFERLVANAPSTTFVVVSKHSGIINFCNELEADYPNFTSMSAAEFVTAQITDKPRSVVPEISFIDRMSNWFDNLVRVREQPRNIA